MCVTSANACTSRSSGNRFQHDGGLDAHNGTYTSTLCASFIFCLYLTDKSTLCWRRNGCCLYLSLGGRFCWRWNGRFTFLRYFGAFHLGRFGRLGWFGPRRCWSLFCCGSRYGDAITGGPRFSAAGLRNLILHEEDGERNGQQERGGEGRPQVHPQAAAHDRGA